MLSKLKAAYKAVPVPVINCLRYGTLFCGAELTQQWYLKRYLPPTQGLTAEPFDTQKLKNLSVYGYVLAPSYMTLFYRILEPRFPGTALRTVVIKVALDQTCLTIPLLFMFYPWMSWCAGHENIFKELSDKFWISFVANCGWWIPAQAVNFALVPPQFRIVYNGAAGFVWAFILLLIKRSGEKEEEKEK